MRVLDSIGRRPVNRSLDLRLFEHLFDPGFRRGEVWKSYAFVFDRHAGEQTAGENFLKTYLVGVGHRGSFQVFASRISSPAKQANQATERVARIGNILGFL